MSIHVCKCEHNGRTEYHLRYPGMTQDEAQALADRINGGELVGAEHPVRKDADRWRYWRNYWPALCRMEVARFAGLDLRTTYVQSPADMDNVTDAAMAAAPAVGAA